MDFGIKFLKQWGKVLVGLVVVCAVLSLPVVCTWWLLQRYSFPVAVVVITLIISGIASAIHVWMDNDT